MSSDCSVITAPLSSEALSGLGIAHADVSLRLQLVRQLRPAGLDDAAVDEHMDELRLDVVENALVVRDQQHAQIGTGQRVDPFRHDAQRVDVETDSGRSTAIWRISARFFSPPEKPSLM